MTTDLSHAAVDLAHEAAFELGRLQVRPSTREVVIAGASEIIEPRIMEVLVALARRRGDVVSRDDLIEACWGGRVVGEDAINRCIGGLRRLADASGAFSITTVPRVGYRLDPVAAPVVSAAPARVTEPGSVVLAVLAFDNLSGDADMAYFSDGVSEEILQTVARGSQLKVIGRGSSFQFRGADKAAGHVAAALNTTHVLDGSVRRSGSTVRIWANLIECAGETNLWSDRFDRELSDVFALQDEIAGAVAEALKVAFAPAVPAVAVDPAAYTLYLQALEIRNRGLEPATLTAALRRLDEATALAPRFARAWAFLAALRAECLRLDEPEQPYPVTRADVVTAAQTALKLDPGSGGAYQALSQLEAFGRFAQREALHETALSAAPNDPTVLTNASAFFAEVGRIQDALGYARQAYTLDPMYPRAANWYANMLDAAGRSEEGRTLWVSACARWPDNELVVWNAIASAANQEDWTRFDELVAAARDRGLDTPTLRRTIAYGRALREASAEARARTLAWAKERLERAGALPLVTYSALCRLGMNDEAFELIDRTSFGYMSNPDQRSPNRGVNSGTIFNVIHNTPMMRDIRFVGLCAKLGLVHYWTTTGRWPDCADAVADAYDFKAEARRLAAVG